MPNWIYRVFIRFLPKILLMTPPAEDDAQSENDESISISGAKLINQSIGRSDHRAHHPPSFSDTQATSGAAPTSSFSCRRTSGPFFALSPRARGSVPDMQLRLSQLAQVKGMSPDVLRRMVDNVHFVAEYFRAKQKRDKVTPARGVPRLGPLTLPLGRSPRIGPTWQWCWTGFC